MSTTHAPADDPAAILTQCWELLADGAASSRSPYHLAAVATLNGSGPDVRTVVLRVADAASRSLIFHTDLRSPKVAHVEAAQSLAWLFYDPSRKVQIRARGRASVHRDDDVAQERWRASSALSRRCYLGARPGSASPTATSGLPAHLAHRAPGGEESEAGRDNFAAVRCEVDELDWLHLHVHGHRRARLRYRDGGWQARWVAP
jgi:hypothetical protein